jgi:CBS domain-containing protein
MPGDFEDPYREGRRAVRSEFEEAYEDERHVRGAILTEPISGLHPHAPAVVSAETPVREVVREMIQGSFGCMLVVEGERLVGIFTERDLLRLVDKETDLSLLTVREVMTRDPETLRPQHGIVLALNRMTEGGYRHIPLVDEEGRPVGVVAMRDIVRFIVSLFPDTVLTVPPDPDAVPEEYGG